MGTKGKRITADVFKNILAWAVAMLVLVPMALIIITSFKTDKESLGMSLTQHRKGDILELLPGIRTVNRCCFVVSR